MFAAHPNRYQVEQIAKLAAEGYSVEEISRTIQVEESGVAVFMPAADAGEEE